MYSSILDITRAFDNISHAHIEQTLHTFPVPSKLKNLIIALLKGNTTSVSIKRTSKTGQISMQKLVAQGAPLSPILFNMALDFLLKELSEKQVVEEYG